MLKLMREQFRNLKIVLWFVVFVFVLLIFVDWGTGRQGERGMTGLAAKMGSIEISEAQFLRELRSTDQRFRELYGDQYDQVRQQMDLPTMAIQNLVDRQLLVRQARKAGLRVSDQELLDKIVSYQAFQREDGTFVGEELYTRILRSNQMAPEEFESALRQDLLLQKLQSTLAAGVVVADAELEREYRRRNEKASFQVYFAGVDAVLSRVQVGDEDVQRYYDANKERFNRPDQRQLRYLLVDDARLRRGMDIPEAQIEEYFRTHAAEFASPEEVRARHILIKAEGDDAGAWERAAVKAQEVYARAAAPNADFAALAREFSDDPGSRDAGGDLSWFPRGRMVKEFEDAAFSLQVGGVSRPVRSQFGFHVIKLEGRRESGQKSLGEVREMIRERLAEGLVEGEGSRRANALREKLDDAKDLSEAFWQSLADEVVTTNVTPFFATTEELIPGIGRDPELLAEVTKAKEGSLGGPRRTSRGWIVYRVAAVREAGVPPLAEIKEEVRAAASRARAADVLRAEFAGLKGSAGSDAIDALVGRYGGAPQEVIDHSWGAAIAGVGVSEALETAVFATPEGGITEPVAIGDRGVAIARVRSTQAFEPARFATEKDALRETLVQDRVQRLLGAMLAEAKREEPVEINPEIVDRFRPQQG